LQLLELKLLLEPTKLIGVELVSSEALPSGKRTSKIVLHRGQVRIF